MARPVCKGFCRDRRLISLLQRIRPRRSPPGQDGDTRAPVLTNSSASCAVFNIRLPERRLTVRPSRRHPLANLACTTGAFAPTERSLRGHGYRPGVKRFPALHLSRDSLLAPKPLKGLVAWPLAGKRSDE